MYGHKAIKAFDVALLSPRGGEEERLQLGISRDGVSLLQGDGTVVDSFPFTRISKWLRADKRAGQAGRQDCIDIQIQTTAGLKAIRVRAIAGVGAAGSILETLQATAEAVAAGIAESPAQMVSPRGQQDVAKAQPEPVAKEQGQSSLLPPKLSDLRGGPSGSPDADPQPGRGGATSLGSPSQISPTPARMSSSPSGPVRQAGRMGPDGDIGMPPSRRRVDIGLLPFPRADGQDPGSDARSNQRFMEDMVRRLTEELARLQGSDQPSADARSVAGATPAAFLEGLADNAPLPLWMTDSKYMSPLLVAYDKHLLEQDRIIKKGAAKISSLQMTITEISAENEKLMTEVQRQMELLTKHAEAQGEISADGTGETLERLDLLTQENELLTQQQAELEEEIARLTSKMEDRTRAQMKMAQESSQLSSRLRAAQHKLSEAEAKAERYKLAAESKDQQSSLPKRQYQAEGAEFERAAEAAARRAAEDAAAVEVTAQQLADVTAEAGSLRQQLLEALGSNNTLQTKVASLQEQYELALANAAAATEEVEELRGAISGMDVRLTEFQHKDAEVYSRIKEAMEQAEEAKLRREALEGRESLLLKENEGLRKKLGALQHQLEARFESEAEVRESSLRAELEVKRIELEDAKMKQAELLATLERKDRDIQSIAAQKRDALAALENVPAGERSLGGGASTLAALERLKDLQEKLDKAEDAAATATRQLENQTKSSELERQGLQAEITTLVRQISSLQSDVAKLQADLAKANLAAEVALREEQEGRQQRVKYEAELRGALESITRDREVEVKRLSGRLEDANALLARTQEEHRYALGAYEAQLGRWKEEAKHLSDKLKVVHQENQEELDRVRESLLSKINSCDGGADRNAPTSSSSTTASDAEVVPAPVAAQLAELLSTEALLIAEKSQLRAALDRALLDKTRADRARDGAQLKAAALQKQCDILQEAAFSRNFQQLGLHEGDPGHWSRRSARTKGRR